MRNTHRLLLSLLCMLVFAGSASVQAAEPLLVDVDWLAQHLKDPKVVVLHVGNREFEAAHIPGAHPISENDVVKPHDMSKADLMLELPTADELRATFQARGVSDDSHIIVYAGKGTAAQSATRIVLTLDYLGLGERTSLLNGGLGAWQSAGRPVETGAARAGQGRLASSTPTKPVIVDAEFVKSLPRRPKYKLVDARAPVYYKGIEATYGKSGHIPGAVSIPFSSIVDDQQRVDRARVESAFREAGIGADDTIVVYCHIGQQATLVALGARLLGHQVMLYDGAFQDWATANRGPVEK